VTESRFAELRREVSGLATRERDGFPRLEGSSTFPSSPTRWPFTNRVGALAEAEGHHRPPHRVGTCHGDLVTHKIRGSTGKKTDFIMARRPMRLAPRASRRVAVIVAGVSLSLSREFDLQGQESLDALRLWRTISSSRRDGRGVPRVAPPRCA